MNRIILPFRLPILIDEQGTNTLSKLRISHDVGAQSELGIKHLFERVVHRLIQLAEDPGRCQLGAMRKSIACLLQPRIITVVGQ